MTRILHILDHSLPLHSGYAFRTRAIMKASETRGWHVEGLTGVRQYQKNEPPGAIRDVEDGLVFHRTPVSIEAPSPLLEWREVLALEQRIVEVCSGRQFDILHAHSPVIEGLAALRAGRRLGLPVVYEIRAFWEDAAVGNGHGSEGGTRYRIVRALETHVARRVDAVVTICEGLQSDLVKRGIDADKIMVSPNGVDMDLFGTLPERDETLAADLGFGDAPVLGFIGSFYDYEGLDDLLAAMPLIAEHAAARGLETPHLLLVGGGPKADCLRSAAKASALADHIHFIGRVPHDEVGRYYGLVDLMVYPRKSMRLTDLVTPLKPLEAMAQGRLVLASDVGGHRELIENGVNGTLFRAGDPAALAEAVAAKLAARDSWQAERERARDHVREQRNWALNASRYAPVYRALMGERTDSRAA